MTKVHVSTQLNAPAAEVWGLIGRWNALPDWHPAVLKSELSEDGKVRRVYCDIYSNVGSCYCMIHGCKVSVDGLDLISEVS